MVDYEFSLPMPPSVNGYWRTFRNRQIISKKGREYKKSVLCVMQDLNLCNEGIAEQLSVSITLHHFQDRKFDIDNYCKCLFDAIGEAGFWLDDSQIFKMAVEKGEKVKGGRVDIKINILS